MFRKNQEIELEGKVEQVTKCLICGAESQKLLFIGQDDRYGYPYNFPVVECMKCGLAYLAVRPHSDELSKIYQKYYITNIKEGMINGNEKNWKIKLKKLPLKPLYRFCVNPRENLYHGLDIGPNKRVLDIGSGIGTDGARQIQRQGSDWFAVEVDANICDILRSEGFSHFCGTLEEFYQTNPEPFDYIILSQVLEHIYEPKQFFKILHALICNNGKIILSCPNYDSFLKKQFGISWLHWHIPFHVAHYNYHTLNLIAQITGFRINKFFTISPITWYYAQLQVAKGNPYSDQWHGKPIIRLQQRLLDLRLSRIHQLNQGDALVAELAVA